jgi:acetoin utilization deacetylase AcuC-like enzyme
MTDFTDHGIDVTDAITAIIRKDEWIASKPWHADLVFPDGTKWKGWQSFFKTKKNLLRAIHAAAPDAIIIDA